jgi:UDP-glucose 4-epimerase
LIASSDRARYELGWKPERSDLAVIVADAWEFARTIATSREKH